MHALDPVRLTALITLLSIAVYFWSSLRVGRARSTFGVQAPAVSGNLEFERIYRGQMNTLEWLPIYLPSLWLFAFTIGDQPAAALGVVWVIGRILYITSYATAGGKRGPGFMIQMAAAAVLWLGALIKLGMAVAG